MLVPGVPPTPNVMYGERKTRSETRMRRPRLMTLSLVDRLGAFSSLDDAPRTIERSRLIRRETAAAASTSCVDCEFPSGLGRWIYPSEPNNVNSPNDLVSLTSPPSPYRPPCVGATRLAPATTAGHPSTLSGRR